jgi:hypothetical protein
MVILAAWIQVFGDFTWPQSVRNAGVARMPKLKSGGGTATEDFEFPRRPRQRLGWGWRQGPWFPPIGTE